MHYDIRIVNGELRVNGQEADDYLDVNESEYQVATSLPVTPELQRLCELCFSAGAEASSRTKRFLPEPGAFVRVPLIGSVD